MKVIIAVDLGGTQIRVASFLPDSTKPLQVKKIPTRSKGETAYERLVGAIASIWPADGSVMCISAAIPGPVDPETGIIMFTPNIPGWENFPLAQKLTERFGVSVFLGNDANMAALGEWKFGAGRGHKHVLYLTISTGIGGGVIVDNQLLSGFRGLAAELGHVTVLPEGPMCGCGRRGHLESISSGTGIANYVKEQLALGTASSLAALPSPSAREIAEAARNGDVLAIQAFERAGKFLGIAMANFLCIFNPSIVIFGGGVSFSGELLFAPMRKVIQEQIMGTSYLDGLEIASAKLGDDAGLIGALALAIYKTKHDN